MVGYCHKVQGHTKLILHTSGKSDRLTSAEAIGRSRIVSVSSDIGVQRIAGVDMEIAEVGVAQRIRRRTRRGMRSLLTMECSLEDEDGKNVSAESNHYEAENRRIFTRHTLDISQNSSPEDDILYFLISFQLSQT